MQSTGSRRVVSSCIPCYTRKKKCNRRYPCNNCTRRRRLEECAYYPSQASQTSTLPPQTEDRQDEDLITGIGAHDGAHDQPQYASSNEPNEPASTFPDRNTRGSSTFDHSNESFAELFGYFEDSESNTMAIVRKLEMGGGGNEDKDRKSRIIPPEDSGEIQKNIERMPSRQIFDFLVQFFVTEVHWMEQLVHPPWFLTQYQQWWSLGPLSSVIDVEFTVLLLRICSYASQFLPSPSYTIDRIRGMLLADIRSLCDDIAERLTVVCVRLDARATLHRVQHLSFLALRYQCEGRTNAFWEALSSAIRAAQRVGIDRNFPPPMIRMHELETEMRRRVFCNLYIWDSLLSRQLDRIPFLPGSLNSENLPRMHLAPNIDDVDVPEGFSERLIQVRLANFWRSFNPGQGAEYDVTVTEERYEKFCIEFLATIPSVFALKPNEEWDDRLKTLPLQRQILHTTIFDSLCYNFRPALLQEPSHVQSLPTYKKVLLSSQRKSLAVAALKVLDGVSKLHAMLGRSHTRFAGIIFPTFEAAVLLVGLCMDVDFPSKDEDSPPSTLAIDPLGAGRPHVTRVRCAQAVYDALARLHTLEEVSKMAEEGARTLARLLGNAPSLHLPNAEPRLASTNGVTEPSSNTTEWHSFETSDLSALNNLFTTSEHREELIPSLRSTLNN